MSSNKVITASIILFGLIGPAQSDNTVIYRQLVCDVGNYGIGITVGDTKNTKDGRVVSKKDFVFTEDGVSFLVKPLAYAKHYAQVSSVNFYPSAKNDKTGLLTVTMSDEGGFTEQIGMVDAACWDTLKPFLKAHAAAVSINEKAAAN